MARAGLTAEILIEAGSRMADEMGLEHTSLAALARQFDVKLASLYAHLRNAEALRTGMALSALAQLADIVAEAIAGRSGKDALAAFANTQRDYARLHPGRFTASRHSMSNEDAMRSAGPRLSQMSRAVLRGYALPEPEETHAVRFLGSTILGFILLESAGGFSHSQPASAESWERTIDTLDAALRHWPRSSQA